MKTYSIFKYKKTGLALMSLLLVLGCQNDDADLQTAKYSNNPNVFIDSFSGGLEYAAFSGTDIFAFQVDNKVAYNNTSASMRFDVPNVNDPAGSYAGGAFFTKVGKDLTSYNALTFWAKSLQTATIGTVGFGLDLGENKYQASLTNLKLSTVWKKYIIPIPDPSKLKIEKGMFYISAGPDQNGNGFSFWVDEVKFEKLGTIALGEGSILNGVNKTETSFVGVKKTIDGLTSIFNLPNGINQAVSLSPAYFVFSSSNPSAATVDNLGKVTILAAGTAVITAKLGEATAKGSLTINSLGSFTHAPTPAQDAAKVLSIYSDKYTNASVEYFNGYWAPYQTTTSADFVVDGDNVLNYANFNFVGIQFSKPTVSVSNMSHLHLDLFMPNAITSGANFKVQVVDFGADGVFGGSDDTSSTVTFVGPTLVSQSWIGLNIPLSSLTGLLAKDHIGQIILSGTNITGFYADNIYFYDDGSVIPSVPVTAAPTPTTAASNVLSIFSDAYTNVAATNFNPSWGQSTVATQILIAGNNTLKYAGLNYQGIELGSAQNVSSKGFLHLDYYSSNSTSLKVYLISPGPVEKAYTISVPSIGGWKSIDIPLTAFSPVNLSNIIQLKFDGNGNIYLDNIYFKN
ncbi:Ig-like domain-containing protein [Flavobacterium cellulosilyticum]|uniref:Glycosyl hydrolase family 16 n=1 Tax=Flavobacterium cellulosilyticum TaxID=2541731 RepID=A0A4R5CBA7_9FLAO|nr:Ig-like domain-containing protein [Flavobacterium cellulosilyticum]TDD95510.1 glycosyl hydrolase family 16 [Flavobacterium cellulosilyticum]